MSWEGVAITVFFALLVWWLRWLWGFVSGCKRVGEIMADKPKNILVCGYQPRARRTGNKDKEPPGRP